MKTKRLGFRLFTLLVTAVIICSATFVPAASASTPAKTDQQVVLKANSTCVVNFDKVVIKAKNSSNSKTVVSAPKGTKLTVISQSGDWYKVKTAAGKTGFVYGKYVAPYTKLTVKRKLESTITLATTTSTHDTGLLDVLVPAFEKKYGVSVKVISVGTGEALKMGMMGDADVVLVHARAQENKFVADGYGVNRRDVMHNEFFIIGPDKDPANVMKAKDLNAAMQAIADSKTPFISRSDKSGTNTKEIALWNDAKIKPSKQSWYVEAGLGMGETIMMAAEKGAYTLTDSGTWFAYMDKVKGMKVVRQGDKTLLNPYGVIAVNPQKNKNVHYDSAMAFVDFVTSPEGQKIIGTFKANGHLLFTPEGTKNFN